MFKRIKLLKSKKERGVLIRKRLNTLTIDIGISYLPYNKVDYTKMEYFLFWVVIGDLFFFFFNLSHQFLGLEMKTAKDKLTRCTMNEEKHKKHQSLY